MKRTTMITFALALALVAGAERFAPASGSFVKVEGTSTLHAWTMQGSTIAGTIETTEAAPRVTVRIPVTSIKSEHAKMDKLMADALRAKEHPEIRYELTTAAPQNGTDTFVTKTKGNLTIAGVTREVTIDIHGTRTADGKYTLTGTAPLKMTAFGIEPPTAMLNTIKTGDDVTVTFRWVVEKAR